LSVAKELAVGSVIELDSPAQDEVTVFADGKPFARGQAVTVQVAGEETPRLGVVIGQLARDGKYVNDASAPRRKTSRVASAAAKAAVMATVLLALLAAPVMGQSTAKASIEDGRVRTPDDDKTTQNTDQPWGFEQVAQTLVALGIVVGLIFAARWGLRRLGRHGGMGGDSELMQVLARSSVGPRMQLMLVRLGRRLVLVGSGPEGLTRLTEITDPAEVSSLVASAESVGRDSLKDLFNPKATSLKVVGAARVSEVATTSDEESPELVAALAPAKGSAISQLARKLQLRKVGKDSI
jgi:flagellar biosynthetic protein FliO